MLALGAAMLASPMPTHAKVVSAAGSSFVVSGNAQTATSPKALWAALLIPDQWWDSQHTWSHDAHHLSLDPRAGGCFCEVLPEGGSVEHMRVLMAMPGQRLRMSGALGPLQGEALTATLTIELEPIGPHATRIGWSYVVGGFMRMDAAQIAPVVDAVLGQQMGRLVAYADHGGTPP